MSIFSTLAGTVIPPWVKPMAIAIAIAVVVGGSYFKGRHDVQIAWDLAKAETKVDIAQNEVKTEKVTEKVVIQYVDRVTTVKVKGETIVQYVDRYITPEEDRKYPLPANFVSLHNAAAENIIPDPAAAADDSPSTVKISEATDTIAVNYNTCNVYRETIIGWQNWAREQKAINP